MDHRKFLTEIKSGKISIDEGLKYLKGLNYKDIDIAKLDFQRKDRRGFGEVIFCERKEIKPLVQIFQAFKDREENVLGTRVTEEQGKILLKEFPEMNYDKIGRTVSLIFEEKEKIGNIAICTGGTADLNVFNEAKNTAEFFGANVTSFIDIGVSGLHRLIKAVPEINKANVIIAIAGMEGALATVMAGLVDKPIIAVPTSVGYGVSENGITALRAMLASCAEGISVVNIDNGFGAAYQAAQINKLVEEK